VRRRIPETQYVHLGPLLDYWSVHQPNHQRANCVCSLGGWCNSVESLARRLGISHSTMYRRLRDNTLDLYEADQWAVTLGLHPNRLWKRFDRIDCHETHEPYEPELTL